MKLIQTFLTLLFVTAIMAIIAISITPLFNAYADTAAAGRASAEAARLQADAAKIDATGDLLNNATLSAIAIGSVCVNSLALMILAVLLFVTINTQANARAAGGLSNRQSNLAETHDEHNTLLTPSAY